MKMKREIVRTFLFLAFLAGAVAALPVHAANSLAGRAANFSARNNGGAQAQTGAAQAALPQKRPITFRDLISMRRVSDPQISPDGKWVAYSISTPDLEANHSVKDIWLVSTDGHGEPKQLTQNGGDTRPRWSSDGKQLAYLSVRDGVQQVYVLTLADGQSRRVTSLSTGADNELWSPDGKYIAFVSRVYPNCADDACNAARDEAQSKSKVKAHIYDHLLYRHWTDWWDGKRSHLFVISAEGGAARDLTPRAEYDVPPFTLGAPEAIAFSPDSAEICFTANTDKDEAYSTNGDLFTVEVNAAEGSANAPRRITTNRGNDWGPVYSPDGRYIAYRSQETYGYESDHWRLMIYNRKSGAITQLARSFDANPESYAWSPDSSRIYFNAEYEAAMPVYYVQASEDPIANAVPRFLMRNGFNAEFTLSADGTRIAFTRTSLVAPAEIFIGHIPGGPPHQLTRQNAAILGQLDMSPAEQFWFAGADGAQVEGLMIRPPNFDASLKYPMLLLIHGGPQGAWDDEWGYRWNPQVMAAPGYVVVMINPHGSTGYGQKFTAEISGDWGGKVLQDLMTGVDYAIAQYPFIDGKRLAAAGGSYGGFMIDWMASQSKGRFKCLISHAGPYDAVSMYGGTEELWFNDWEYKGNPWDNPALYDKWNPSKYAADFGKYKTPTLIIGGELDFRIPYTQELEFFTALQRQGVPSRLIIFPDEGHWVLKPQNSELWYREFLGWLAKWL
jgi:dipeptidyl aminopeptidase/acylaminoacyl peptidase